MAGTLAIWLGGGPVAAREASESIPKPPNNPGWQALGEWIVSGSDPAALIAAFASGLGLVASLFQIFGPKPYTAHQGREDRAHQNASFAAAAAQRQQQQAELLAAIGDLKAQVAQFSPQQAAPFAEALGELAQSDAAEDIAIAQQAVDGSPEAAANALMAEVESGKLRNAERARQAARIYAPFAPGKAKAAYEEATQLDPADLWSWIELGHLRMQYDSLQSAQDCFNAGLQHAANERDRMALHSSFGDVLMAMGALNDARHEYESALAIAQTFARTENGNTKWQHDLSVSHDRLGDVEVAAGNLAEARNHFEAGLAIRETLARIEPGIAQWQSDLTVSYDRLGDIEVAAGNLAEARRRYEAGLAIRETLAHTVRRSAATMENKPL